MTIRADSVFSRWKAGELDWHIEQGIIRTSVITYCKVFDRYTSYREAGLTYLQGIARTSEDMNTSPETVKRAIAELV